MGYENLILKLKEKRIDFKAVASYIGIDEKTFLNKAYGRTQSGFYWSEVCKIHQAFLSEYQLDFLFARDEDSRNIA